MEGDTTAEWHSGEERQPYYGQTLDPDEATAIPWEAADTAKLASLDEDEPVVTVVAPEESRRTLGSFLRSCAGVDETLIRQVWPVRHRYVGLGGIVLGTAAAAAVSMALAISLTASGLRWYHLIFPLLWGLLVFNLDRWLVSSTHGVGRPWKLIPRLAIAILFGFIIAEPVVLWIFGDAIEEQIRDERDTEINNAITLLKECNPEDDLEVAAEKTSDPDCQGFIVDRSIPAPLATSTGSAQIAQLEQEIVALDERLAPIEAELSDANDRYQREIRGDSSGDTSGRRGIGPIAEAIAQSINQLTADRDAILDARSTALADLQRLQAELDTEQADLDVDQRTVLEAYAEATSEAVEERIAEVEALNGESIGLLQRFDALSELASEHTHIFIARWLLTIFLIAIDSMPVIAKAIGGKSAYDHMYSRSLSAAQRHHHRREQYAEQEDVKDLELYKFRSRLHRSVARKSVVVGASGGILRLDDQLMQLHDERNMPYDRPTLDFTDGEPVSRPHSALSQARPLTSYDFQPVERSLNVSGSNGTMANGGNHDSTETRVGGPEDKVALGDTAVSTSTPTGLVTRTIATPAAASPEADWLTNFAANESDAR